jgi:hypothetical protein
MKAFLLGVALTVLWALTPFRILALAGETFWVRPGEAHYDAGTDRYWDTLQLEATLISRGWAVGYVESITYYGNPAWGLTNRTDHTIYVEDSLRWNARLAILAHEAGHTMQPSWLNPEEADCFAESVSALVSRDGLRNHAHYLARSRWTCLGTMLAVYPEMYRAAATLKD